MSKSESVSQSESEIISNSSFSFSSMFDVAAMIDFNGVDPLKAWTVVKMPSENLVVRKYPSWDFLPCQLFYLFSGDLRHEFGPNKCGRFQFLVIPLSHTPVLKRIICWYLKSIVKVSSCQAKSRSRLTSASYIEESGKLPPTKQLQVSSLFNENILICKSAEHRASHRE